MAYLIKTFSQIRKIILQEYRNVSGLNITDDSDAAIRADGTASVVEGLYHHQSYIQRQLFIGTADESYLYIHADELGLPRLGGTKATGVVQANTNTPLTLLEGTKLTDGKGFYWLVVNQTELTPNQSIDIDVIAERTGSSWNYQGDTLMWVSPLAGLNGNANVISLEGGTDEEELENWRARLLERKQLGFNRDRSTDLKSVLKTVPGIKDIYIYPKRRGLGSLDAAITAIGNPPTLPSKALIDAAQAVLDDYAGFWADCRIFEPTEQKINLTILVTGTNADLQEVEKTTRAYIAELAPADTFQVATLTAHLMALTNVTDISITPNTNIKPIVNWMYVHWLRAGKIQVRSAT